MKRFSNILCLLKPDDDMPAALKRAVALADKNQAALKVMMWAPAVRGEGKITNLVLQDWRDKVAKKLDQIVKPYQKEIDLHASVITGTSLFIDVIRQVLLGKHDLVIKAIERPSEGQSLDGEDMRLLRKCPCPVWLMADSTGESYKSILSAVDVADDYSASGAAVRHDLNEQVFELACSTSSADLAELHLAYAWEPLHESALRHSGFFKHDKDALAQYLEEESQKNKALLEDFLTQQKQKWSPEEAKFLSVTPHCLKGAPKEEISGLASQVQADLIVMGTVGRTGVAGFIMGNTAESILRRINCDVLAIKPKGFESPVKLD